VNSNYKHAVYHYYTENGKYDEYKSKKRINTKGPMSTHRAFCVTVYLASLLGAGCQCLIKTDTERLPVQLNKCLGDT
jgi:hypothetical protein